MTVVIKPMKLQLRFVKNIAVCLYSCGSLDFSLVTTSTMHITHIISSFKVFSHLKPSLL